MKDTVFKIILVLVIIFVIIGIVNLVKIKNDSSYKNNFYNNKNSKVQDDDFIIGDISLNMTIEEVKEKLGEPKEVSEYIDYEDPQSSYKRFDYDNLIIQFDYEKLYVNYIASSRENYQNNRKISVGDTVTDILKAYYADKNIDVYENVYGTYEFLYGEDDAKKYLDELSTENKTFGYIYKYNNEINSIIFSDEGKVLEFYLTNNKINMIIIAEKYIPW